MCGNGAAFFSPQHRREIMTQEELRARALKAWETRRENERKKRASEAAKKAWRTRRQNQNQE